MFATLRPASLLTIPVLIFFLLSLNSVRAQSDSTAAEATSEPTTETATSEGGGSNEAVIAEGESLFKANCRACHAVDQKLVGPALAGVYDRRDMDWIKAFVKNSQAVIASGDDYAVSLYEEYNQTVMTSFNLNDSEIESIIAYVKYEAENAATADAAQPGATGEVMQTGSQQPSTFLTVVVIGLVIVLILILVVLFLIINFLTKFLQQREGLDVADREIVSQKLEMGRIVRSPAFVGIVAFVFGIFVLKSVIDGLYQVGIQKGYAPKQPIAFSHKLHAGQYEIDCNYCHTGVRKSKSANIPSANICMNCHGQILTESPEIQKIYAAIENNRPIEWVRVHNLPDLAYFNHAQHVEVGGQECQTCHGEIQEMEVVEQHAPLTMGWCINCHKETNVNTKGNAYYDNLVELHSQHSSQPLKVEDIGGLECAKCHY